MPGTIPKPLEPVVREFATVAGHLWQLGWAEASAGNISVAPVCVPVVIYRMA